ncbi:MAG: DUF421 domain-containing protein, partial [Bacilli bacterium]
RTVIMYIFTLFVFRLMGKREIGELSVFDLVVFLMIAEIVSLSLEHEERSVWYAMVPILVLSLLQIALSVLSLKFSFVRQVMEGEPVMLIRDGKIDERAMRRIRYNFEDILTQLRDKGIADIRDVAYAIVETSGKLSVFEKEKDNFTLALILDGEIQYENLKEVKHGERWLIDELGRLGYENLQRISYASYRNGSFFIDIKNTD